MKYLVLISLIAILYGTIRGALGALRILIDYTLGNPWDTQKGQ